MVFINPTLIDFFLKNIYINKISFLCTENRAAVVAPMLDVTTTEARPPIIVQIEVFSTTMYSTSRFNDLTLCGCKMAHRGGSCIK